VTFVFGTEVVFLRSFQHISEELFKYRHRCNKASQSNGHVTLHSLLGIFLRTVVIGCIKQRNVG